MISDRTLAKMIEAMNKHLPVKRRTLSEMLNEDEPTIRAQDGNEYLIEKHEMSLFPSMWMSLTGRGLHYLLFLR
jgi:uncharacterized protein (UPF0216 family)